MRKLYVVGLLCLLSACATNRIEKQYYENGNIKSEISYDKDNNVILIKGYYETGELVLYGDTDIGRWYYPSGQISEEIPFKDNKKHGTKKIYEPDGKLTKEIYYEKGVKIWQKEYDEYENLVKETSYYSNGNIWTEAFYEDGKKILKQEYDENGNLRNKEEYKNDKIVSSEFSTFTDKGVLLTIKTKYFDDNKEVEREEEFYINDSLYNIYKYNKNDILIEEIGYLKSGKEKSDEKYYYENGNLKREIIFKNGIQIEVKEYDKDGNVISEEKK